MLNSALASTDSWILSNGTRWCGTGAPLFERVLARAARDNDALLTVRSSPPPLAPPRGTTRARRAGPPTSTPITSPRIRPRSHVRMASTRRPTALLSAVLTTLAALAAHGRVVSDQAVSAVDLAPLGVPEHAVFAATLGGGGGGST